MLSKEMDFLVVFEVEIWNIQLMLYCVETFLDVVIGHTVLHVEWIEILGAYRIDCSEQSILPLLPIKEDKPSSFGHLQYFLT